MGTTDSTTIDGGIKARHRAVWEMGDYPTVAGRIIPDLGEQLVQACGVEAGDAVLDVACGSGNATIPAALRGATVTGCDLAPALLDAARAAAEAIGAVVDWREGDAESLPFADAGFDVVLSCVGVMFAPDHRAAAGELLRVCRPGGTIGLASWTPEGFIGELFSTMAPFVPAPPAGARPPVAWGSEAHVRDLLGDGVVGVETSRRQVTVDAFATAEEFRAFFTANYGPTLAAYRGLADDPERVAALDDAIRGLAERHDRGNGSLVMEWEVLFVTARRAV